MSILLSLWFVWCILGGAILVIAVKSIIRWWLASSHEESSPDFDRMSGEEFEAYLADLFLGSGYQVFLTQKSHDYGADLILEREKRRIVVQAKRQRDHVGVIAVQQVVAAKAMYACTEAMVVTNTMYTQPAWNLAQVNQVELWDRQALLRAIETRQAQQRADRLQALALHRMSSISAVLIASFLLSCGLVGFWRQGFSALKLQISTQPVANNILSQPGESGPAAAAAVLEATASSTSAEGVLSEDLCGSAVVQVVAALAIRQEPSLASDAVGEVPQGRKIKLVCAPTVTANGITWQMVDYGIGRGWMSRKYLLVEQQ